MQKRDGNGHALSHSARKFMRIGIQARCRIWNANPCEAARRKGECSALSTATMRLNGHGHLLTNGEHWIQRGRRVLENHGNPLAAQFAHFGLR